MSTIAVTVVVPVKNEEANLARCLEQLHRFSEIIIADSMSTDRTREIARSYGAKILDFQWNGRYPKKRNWVLINHPPSTPWVLFLDADEYVNDTFCDAVSAAIANERFDGYWLNYTNYFLGRRLKYGVPQRKLALFRVGKAFYEQISEETWSGLDMEIHEHPVIAGQVGEIKVPIEHNDFRGIRKFVNRHCEYASWEAHLVLSQEARGPGSDLTPRQRFKYANLERWWYPWIYFAYTFFVRLGLLDGVAGFQHAFYKSWYFLTIQLILRELRKAERPR